MNKKFVLKILVAANCIFLLVSCSKKQPEQQYPPMELPVAQIQQGNGLVKKEYPVSIEGVTDVEIRPQVSGYLQKILVDEGGFVKEGQPLFKIDDRIYTEQYNTAKASVTAAQANLTNVKIDLERKKELVKERIVSNLQLQEAQANFEAATATVNQAKAAAQAAQINYEFCTIKAPVSGYLGRINYRLGSLIGPTGAQPITLLSDNQIVNVYFSMSEMEFMEFQKKYEGNSIEEKIKNSDPVRLQIADGQMFEHEGKIDAIEGQFNASTGSVSFRAKFNNPKRFLRSGNTGKIIIEQQYSNAILVPIASTFNIQDKVYLFALDKENKAIQVSLDVLGKSGTNYMIGSGVNMGDSYIVSGFERLQTGMPIVAKSADQKQAEQASPSKKES